MAYSDIPLCSTAEMATIGSEISKVFGILNQIEERIFLPEPVNETNKQIASNNKFIYLRNDISDIAERLYRINEALELVGK